MYYGVHVPNLGEFGDARTLADLAREAEEAGWDGFFIWDGIASGPEALPVVDPWVALAAIAVRTERVRLGPLVTAVARRRPWKLARETVTLDHLSGGRLLLGVGLGSPAEWEFAHFGEEPADRVRAAKLDDGLAVLAGLWSGRPFSYHGDHYHVQDVTFVPPPVQSPRIPIWVGGWWPNKAPMRRAARWDGVFPGKLDRSGTPTVLSPGELRDVLAYVEQHRTNSAPFDVVCNGYTPGDDPARGAAIVVPYVQAGLTWWMEAMDPWHRSFAEARTRIRQGPPKA